MASNDVELLDGLPIGITDEVASIAFRSKDDPSCIRVPDVLAGRILRLSALNSRLERLTGTWLLQMFDELLQSEGIRMDVDGNIWWDVLALETFHHAQQHDFGKTLVNISQRQFGKLTCVVAQKIQAETSGPMTRSQAKAASRRFVWKVDRTMGVDILDQDGEVLDGIVIRKRGEGTTEYTRMDWDELEMRRDMSVAVIPPYLRDQSMRETVPIEGKADQLVNLTDDLVLGADDSQELITKLSSVREHQITQLQGSEKKYVEGRMQEACSIVADIDQEFAIELARVRDSSRNEELEVIEVDPDIDADNASAYHDTFAGSASSSELEDGEIKSIDETTVEGVPEKSGEPATGVATIREPALKSFLGKTISLVTTSVAGFASVKPKSRSDSAPPKREHTRPPAMREERFDEVPTRDARGSSSRTDAMAANVLSARSFVKPKTIRVPVGKGIPARVTTLPRAYSRSTESDEIDPTETRALRREDYKDVDSAEWMSVLNRIMDFQDSDLISCINTSGWTNARMQRIFEDYVIKDLATIRGYLNHYRASPSTLQRVERLELQEKYKKICGTGWQRKILENWWPDFVIQGHHLFPDPPYVTKGNLEKGTLSLDAGDEKGFNPDLSPITKGHVFPSMKTTHAPPATYRVIHSVGSAVTGGRNMDVIAVPTKGGEPKASSGMWVDPSPKKVISIIHRNGGGEAESDKSGKREMETSPHSFDPDPRLEETQGQLDALRAQVIELLSWNAQSARERQSDREKVEAAGKEVEMLKSQAKFSQRTEPAASKETPGLTEATLITDRELRESTPKLMTGVPPLNLDLSVVPRDPGKKGDDEKRSGLIPTTDHPLADNMSSSGESEEDPAPSPLVAGKRLAKWIKRQAVEASQSTPHVDTSGDYPRSSARYDDVTFRDLMRDLETFTDNNRTGVYPTWVEYAEMLTENRRDYKLSDEQMMKLLNKKLLGTAKNYKVMAYRKEEREHPEVVIPNADRVMGFLTLKMVGEVQTEKAQDELFNLVQQDGDTMETFAQNITKWVKRAYPSNFEEQERAACTALKRGLVQERFRSSLYQFRCGKPTSDFLERVEHLQGLDQIADAGTDRRRGMGRFIEPPPTNPKEGSLVAVSPDGSVKQFAALEARVHELEQEPELEEDPEDGYEDVVETLTVRNPNPISGGYQGTWRGQGRGNPVRGRGGGKRRSRRGRGGQPAIAAATTSAPLTGDRPCSSDQVTLKEVMTKLDLMAKDADATRKEAVEAKWIATRVRDYRPGNARFGGSNNTRQGPAHYPPNSSGASRPARGESGGGPPFTKGCFRCGKEGHWARQCPVKQCNFCTECADEVVAYSAEVCYYCEDPGTRTIYIPEN